MPIYKWSGLDQSGKTVSGTTWTTSRKQLKLALIKNRIFPRRTKLQLTSLIKMAPKQITNFIAQLAVLINANTPIIRALTIILQDEPNPQLRGLILECKNSIAEGKSLAQSWQQYPHYFPELSCSIVHIGEQAGTLDIMLTELANHLKKTEAQKRKIIKALLYPMMVLVITLVTTAILLVLVIPQFEMMFSEFGAELPSYTSFIITLSKLLQKAWWLILVNLIGITIGSKILAKHSPKFHHYLDQLYLKLPLIKTILTHTIIFRFTKTLGLTLKSGIPMLKALNLSASVIPNWSYRSAIEKTIKLVTGGQSLHSALHQQLFPTKVIQLIALGEETGSLDLMLEKLATIYNEEVNNFSDNLNTLLEPIIMLILGVIVGGIIIGMYLPIFRLGLVI